MNYLIGLVIIIGGLLMISDPNPPITPFGIPKGVQIPFNLNVPCGILLVLLGIFYIYREIKK